MHEGSDIKRMWSRTESAKLHLHITCVRVQCAPLTIPWPMHPIIQFWMCESFLWYKLELQPITCRSPEGRLVLFGQQEVSVSLSVPIGFSPSTQVQSVDERLRESADTNADKIISACMADEVAKWQLN